MPEPKKPTKPEAAPKAAEKPKAASTVTPPLTMAEATATEPEAPLIDALNSDTDRVLVRELAIQLCALGEPGRKPHNFLQGRPLWHSYIQQAVMQIAAFRFLQSRAEANG